MKSIRLFLVSAGLSLWSSHARSAIPMTIPLDAKIDGIDNSLSWGIGSDGFRRPSDPKGVFYTITDRGPNIDCEDSSKLLGWKVCSKGKIFPMPQFNPSILKWKIDELNRPQLLSILPLRNRNQDPVSGLSNPWTSATAETAFDWNGDVLRPDPDGIDPEGLVMLSDNSFWVTEEYGPSLMHIAPSGEILERWVPEGMEHDLATANYPVLGKLPAILKQRKLNRGLEALALSPDGERLTLAMQSALENPGSKTAKSSRVVRILTVDLNQKKVDGMYAYEMDAAENFEAPHLDSVKSSDLKISAMTFLGNRLLIQERTDETMKIFECTLGPNLLNTKLATSMSSPTLEESKTKGFSKRLVWDALTAKDVTPKKIEGMVVMDNATLLLVNDNDFGVSGETSEALLIQPKK